MLSNIGSFYLWKRKNTITNKIFISLNILYFLWVKLLSIYESFNLFNNIDKFYYKVLYNIYQNLDFIDKYIGNLIAFLFATKSEKTLELLPETMTIIIGFIAIVTAIYVHILGTTNKVKRYLLNNLSENETIMFLIVYILVMILFGVNTEYIIGLFIISAYLLLTSIKWVINFNSPIYYRKDFYKILKDFNNKVSNEKILDLYDETQMELRDNISTNNLILIEITYKYLLYQIELFSKSLFFSEEPKEVNYFNDNIQTREDYKYVKNLYKVAKKNEIDHENIFYFHSIIANKFYKKDINRFGTMLYLSIENYRYYLDSEGKNESFLRAALEPLEKLIRKIYEDYDGDFDKGKVWMYEVYKIITEMIEMGIAKNDEKSIKELKKLIEIYTKYEENYNNENSDYFLLEASIYFQLLVYLEIKGVETELIKKDELKNKIINLLKQDIPKIYQYMEFFNFIPNNYLIGSLDWNRYIRVEFNIVGITDLPDEKKLRTTINNIILEIFTEIEKMKFQDYSEISMYDNEFLKKIETTFVGNLFRIEETHNNDIKEFSNKLRERNPSVKDNKKVVELENRISKETDKN